MVLSAQTIVSVVVSSVDPRVAQFFATCKGIDIFLFFPPIFYIKKCSRERRGETAVLLRGVVERPNPWFPLSSFAFVDAAKAAAAMTREEGVSVLMGDGSGEGGG